MLATCIRNSSKDLTWERKADLLRYIHYDNSQLDELSIGIIYQVHGLVFRDNVPWYYIDAHDLDYPTPYPSDYFQPLTEPIPLNWRLVTRRLDAHTFETSVVPEFWANDVGFYERLVDGEKEAVQKFNQLKISSN